MRRPSALPRRAVLGPTDPAQPSAQASSDPTLLRQLLTALDDFDARRLEPLVVPHVHLTDAALTARTGVTRVEELGPVVLGEVRDWLVQPYGPDRTCPRIELRPVLDADALRPVDRNEWPTPVRDLTTLRTPCEVFPWGTP